MSEDDVDAESARLADADAGRRRWKLWGPYLSERQWGTVREDYSADGDAWNYFPHDHARSRAYRWGEDGLAGFSDDQQRLCLALALWNGQDPILKERLFGLTNLQGNHGEDVKELYYYLDATPTYSYARMLYKYPQGAYPYERLLEENGRRGLTEPEFELIDTGLFDDDRYFDIDVAYAKADVADILMRITVHNRGPQDAPLHLLPQVWFRDTWSWRDGVDRPRLAAAGPATVALNEPVLGAYTVQFEAPDDLLFCDNETNAPKLYGAGGVHGWFKDAFHAFVVDGRTNAVNPARTGSKAAALYRLDVPAGGSRVVRVRLVQGNGCDRPFADFDAVVEARSGEADRYHAGLTASLTDEDERQVHRQAIAGMLWSKQFFLYDVRQWLAGDPREPAPPAERRRGRNSEWRHLNAADVISMPDKWEYPWFAAWDLAFHCVTLATVDPAFAKWQLVLLGHEWYMHPNGQWAAYEWNFSDVNPPLHAWATWQVYQIDRHANGGRGDLSFLERVFHKLMLNFTWWVNREDRDGRDVFQGGFLGLDNIGCFDRSAPLPTGGHLNQSDATAWMGMTCLNMLRIALELAQTNPAYEDIATKFFEHFLGIAYAMTNMGEEGIGLWDEADGFYYDFLSMPGDVRVPLRVRSMVGIIPLFAVEILDEDLLAKVPNFTRRLDWYLQYRPDLARLVSHWAKPGERDRRLLAIVRAFRMKKILQRLFDPDEFLSDYGIRSVSRHHLEHPYVFEHGGAQYGVHYAPGESDSRLFGGNSNWRGPIWMPLNYLIVRTLKRYHTYYGEDFRVECPTGSGQMLTLAEAADELARRLMRLFLRDGDGRRPVFGTCDKLQTSPAFRDHVPFHEYFHGDTGKGLGASHQTGWTGLIAKIIIDRSREVLL
jgi:hypothetical protein